LSGRAPVVNTAHVATGALVLATSLLLALRVNRHRFPDARPSVAYPQSPVAVPAKRAASGAVV